MKQRPPSKLYSALEKKLKEYGWDNHLVKLRNPPYLEDCQPQIDAYVSKIRTMQKIVREQVCQVRLIQTETDGVEEGYLFDTGLAAVLHEFDNWGLCQYSDNFQSINPDLGVLGILKGNFQFVNTGHRWVTVKSARFKNQTTAKNTLENLKEIQTKLNELNKPIVLFDRYLLEYEEEGLNRIEHEFIEKYNMIKEEKKRLSEIKKKFLVETYFIRKGILSLSFVGSLLYRLEESLNLSKNHPGD